MPPVLQVDKLKTYFYLEDEKVAKAVDDISFAIYPGETVALVGESGSGKSMTGLSVMRLITPPGEIVNGSIKMNDTDILALRNRDITQVRGNDIAMIFQEPMTALNPVFTIGKQIPEVHTKHKKMSTEAARQKAIDLLNMVGIPRAKDILNEYPHQLSGGMRQRVMIAIAISCEPKLLIADEPTTALDVTIQAQILELLKDVKEMTDSAILLITHDLGVVAEMADRVLVMYAGQVVEEASVTELFDHPKHPYTKGLLESIPKLDEEQKRLSQIKGIVPSSDEFPEGCRFASRCKFATEECLTGDITLRQLDNDHKVRCVLYDDVNA